MKTAAAALAVLAVSCVAAIGASAGDRHALVTPDAIEWGPGPASIPPGAQAVVLYGDPTKAELFALRIKVPAGYRFAPHSHPKPEIVTVISGALRLGIGEVANPEKVEILPAGSFIVNPPGLAHFAYTEEETILQLNSIGPWSLTYLHPEDDPRQ